MCSNVLRPFCILQCVQNLSFTLTSEKSAHYTLTASLLKLLPSQNIIRKISSCTVACRDPLVNLQLVQLHQLFFTTLTRNHRYWVLPFCVPCTAVIPGLLENCIWTQGKAEILQFTRVDFESIRKSSQSKERQHQVLWCI